MRFLSITWVVALCLMLTSSARRTTIFMVGDSTMANKDISHGSPERGWGMVLQGFFDEDIVVDNHALNGRSSVSFIREGRWQAVLDRIKPGDYVLIQFGHNDEKTDKGKGVRHTTPGTTFDATLAQYVDEARQRGGIPVLLNCVERRLFYNAAAPSGKDDETLRDTPWGKEQVNTDTLVPTHVTSDGDYTAAPRRVAEAMGVTFIDATAISHRMEQSFGVEGSRRLHMWLKPGEVKSIPKGRQDNTHYSVYGAHVIAGLLADAIGEAIPALKKHVRHYDYIVSDKGRGNFLSLDEAVDAVPEGKSATILVLDGKYERLKLPKGVRLEIRQTATVK